MTPLDLHSLANSNTSASKCFETRLNRSKNVGISAALANIQVIVVDFAFLE